MGPIPHSKERILVKIKFECRPVLMSKHHDSLLFNGTLQIGIGLTLCSFEHVSCFWKYKVYGDIPGGYSWRGRQMKVGLTTTAIFGDLFLWNLQR